MARARKRSSLPAAKTAGVPRAPSIIWFYLGLLAVTMAVYSQAAGFGFVNYDDPDHLSANPHVMHGFSMANIAWAFTSAHASNWIPLTWLSYMLDTQIFGLRSGPLHLVNVALHAISTLLLFGFLHRATGARWRSALVALVFALHPLHVESVAWLAERKDVLCVLFCLLTLWAYLKYSERPSALRYAAVALLFACALLAKPLAVTLPLVLLLLDLWPLRRFERTKSAALVTEKLPLLALSMAASIVTYVVQQGSGAISGVERIPLLDRISNALASYFIYLVKFAWPSNLAVFYPYPNSPAWILAAAGLITIALLTWLALRQVRARPYFATGWLWYLITLLPMIGLVQAGLQARADRYMYLPMIGLSIAITWGLADWFERRKWNQSLLAAAACAVCAAWTVVTFETVDNWRDSIALFEHAVAVTEGNYVAHHNLGVALRDAGRVDDAVVEFQEAVSIRPQAADMQENLGEALIAAGRAAEAEPHLVRALELRPDFAKAHVDLGSALVRTGKMNEAASQYREALRLQPDFAEAHYGLGGILARQGLMREANAEFENALPYLIDKVKQQPDSVDDRYNLGTVYAMMGRVDEAIAQFQETVRLRPDDAEAHFNLGTALASRGRGSEAVDQFAAAVKLRPDYVRAHLSLARTLASLGRTEEARREFDEALRIDPNSAEARAGATASHKARAPGKAR